MKFLTCQNPEQLIVAQVLIKILNYSVAEIRSIINVHYVGSIKDPNGGYGYPMIKDYSDFLKGQ